MAGGTSQKTLISEGFEGRRGMVFGLTMSGAGLGTVALVPMTQWMLAGWGWRIAYLTLAGFSALIFLELLILAGTALWKTPVTRPPASVPYAGPSFKRWRQALFGERPTQLVMICSFFSGFQRTIVIVHLIPHLARAGHNPAMAIGAFVIGDLLRSFSSPIAGYLVDRFGSRATYLFSTCTAAVAILFFNTLGASSSMTTLYGIAVLYGLASGGIQPSSATIQADVFPAQDRGRMFGTTNMQYNLGSAASAWLGAWIFDLTGEYRFVILLASVSLIIMATTMTSAATLVRKQAALELSKM